MMVMLLCKDSYVYSFRFDRLLYSWDINKEVANEYLGIGCEMIAVHDGSGWINKVGHDGR